MKKLVTLMLALFLSFGMASAQKMSKKERKAQRKLEVTQLVESGNYQFSATNAYPMSAGQINLTSDYSLDIKGDSVVAYLPYFGRAYQAPYGGGEGGIKFSEKAEELSTSYNEKKEMYTVTMKIDDEQDNYDLVMTIGKEGYANLNVNCTNKQPISFRGNIEKIEDE